MRLNGAMMEAKDFKTPDTPFTYTPLLGKETRLLVIPLPDDEKWTAVRCLLSSPDFRRTWIVQELILTREVRIMIDELECPFDMDGSLGFRDFLGMHEDRNLSPVQGPYLGSEADDVRTLLRVRSFHRQAPGSSSQALLPLLCDIGDSGVADPRDKVYGNMSIASDAKKFDILPDYSASTTACYIDTTHKLITKTQSLDILLCKETLRQIDGLPTWAPDWSCSMLEVFETYIGMDKKLYNATKSLKLTIRNFKDVSKLGIQEYTSIQSPASPPDWLTSTSRACSKNCTDTVYGGCEHTLLLALIIHTQTKHSHKHSVARA
ncbi:hypothetical protein HD806DRAFT_552620 [Xylariaceae sp. AK1471]|nr:hypothetical protein HD806DRAFT_552620 [Xylariaceae sp. AK1471]